MNEINEPEINNNDIQESGDNVGKQEAPLTKPKRKHTVPQSQKQKDNFIKARLQRAANIKLKNEEKETEMVNKYIDILAKSKKAVKTKLPAVPEENEEEEEEEEEDEVVYVKKIKKKKAPAKAPVKNKKVTYVYESDSDPDPPLQSRRVNRASTPKAPEPEIDYTLFFT
jgi:hypothetical protein